MRVVEGLAKEHAQGFNLDLLSPKCFYLVCDKNRKANIASSNVQFLFERCFPIIWAGVFSTLYDYCKLLLCGITRLFAKVPCAVA